MIDEKSSLNLQRMNLNRIKDYTIISHSLSSSRINIWDRIKYDWQKSSKEVHFSFKSRENSKVHFCVIASQICTIPLLSCPAFYRRPISHYCRSKLTVSCSKVRTRHLREGVTSRRVEWNGATGWHGNMVPCTRARLLTMLLRTIQNAAVLLKPS